MLAQPAKFFGVLKLATLAGFFVLSPVYTTLAAEYQYESFACRYFNVILIPFGGCMANYTMVPAPVVPKTVTGPLAPPALPIGTNNQLQSVRGATTTTNRKAPSSVINVTDTPASRTTYVTNYITQPTEVIREIIVKTRTVTSGEGLTRTLFDKQVDALFDSTSNRLRNLRKDISEALVTDELTLSGVLLDATDSAGSAGYVLVSTGSGVTWVATSSLGIATAGGGGGGVSSVALAAPMGFTVSGSPITGAGTLTLNYAAGYEGLLSASSTNWNSFYTSPATRITAGNNIDWTGSTLDVITTGDWNGTFDGQEGSYYLARGNQTGTQSTSTITGVFGSLNGGTGLTTVTQNQLLIGGAGNTWSQIATSSLGFAGLSDLATYLPLSGGSLSGNLAFTGTSANIALGSNYLSGDGGDEGIFVGGTLVSG